MSILGKRQRSDSFTLDFDDEKQNDYSMPPAAKKQKFNSKQQQSSNLTPKHTNIDSRSLDHLFNTQGSTSYLNQQIPSFKSLAAFNDNFITVTNESLKG